MTLIQPAEQVICIHGLWMNGMEMGLLRRRLQRAGFTPSRFRHATILGDFDSALDQLEALLLEQQQPFHLVAHSLGGLLVRHLLARQPNLCCARIVTLGTPHTGSGVARALAQHPRSARLLLGSSLIPLQLTPPPLPDSCELGSIAGTLSLGMGRLLPGLASPNDGTVALSETHCPGERDHLSLHQSHFGLLFSAQTANQVVRFLHDGAFDHAPTDKAKVVE